MILKVSDYTIFGPQIRSNEAIIAHGYTGAIDIVGTDVYISLRRGMYAIYKLPTNVINLLMKRGYLTTKKSKEEMAMAINMACLIKKNILSAAKHSFTIVLQYGCNLRCDYCYENKLRRKGRAWLEKVLTETQADEIFVAIRGLYPTCRESIKLILFGGEPLQNKNRSTIEYLLKKGVQNNCVFSAITNGLELDSFIDCLGDRPGKIGFIQVTLDGPREIHNKRRFCIDGSGTFDRIINNIDQVVKTESHIMLRVNIDKRNIEYLSDLMNIITEHKWLEFENFKISFSPINNSAWNFEYFQIIEEILSKDVVRKNITQININNDLTMMIMKCYKNGLPLRYKQNICASWNNGYVFDPFGSIYPCWECIGVSDFQIGTYFPKIKFNSENKILHEMKSDINCSSCCRCKYLLLCGGGCPYKIYRYGAQRENCCENFSQKLCFSLRYSYEVIHEEMRTSKQLLLNNRR